MIISWDWKSVQLSGSCAHYRVFILRALTVLTIKTCFISKNDAKWKSSSCKFHFNFCLIKFWWLIFFFLNLMKNFAYVPLLIFEIIVRNFLIWAQLCQHWIECSFNSIRKHLFYKILSKNLLKLKKFSIKKEKKKHT